jgi:hypothetical protein
MMAKNTSSKSTKKEQVTALAAKSKASGGKSKATPDKANAKTKLKKNTISNPRAGRVSSNEKILVDKSKVKSDDLYSKGRNEIVGKTLKMVKTSDSISGVDKVQMTGFQESLKVMPVVKSGFPLLFTNKRKAYIEGYIRELLVIMRLQDWTITLDWSISKDQDAYATILSSPDQKRATLNLTLKFLELDSKERSQTLVHELMHCHLFSLHYLAEKSMEQASSKKVSEMFLVGFDCEIEKATDAIADIIAPFVPKFILPV